jgi:hypothetical protein
MLWFTLWFLVILKIPALYLCYVIWWAVKDPPQPAAGGTEEGFGGGGLDPRPRPPLGRIPRRRSGPHGSPARRHRRTEPVLARARAPR